MYDTCTFVAVAWNEEARAEDLLMMARAWFKHMVIGVQQSTDRTLEIVQTLANRDTDKIIQHPHLGIGDASMPDLIAAVPTAWAFVVAFDEFPSQELLESLGDAMAYAKANRSDALWIPFRSIVEGNEYKEQHGHLRLFRASLGWPKTMHSRPKGRNEMSWDKGYILHERSLNEMMLDYLRYYEMGKGNQQWEKHNKLMMHDACVVIAGDKGWDFIKSHDWWSTVERIAFASGS